MRRDRRQCRLRAHAAGVCRAAAGACIGALPSCATALIASLRALRSPISYPARIERVSAAFAASMFKFSRSPDCLQMSHATSSACASKLHSSEENALAIVVTLRDKRLAALFPVISAQDDGRSLFAAAPQANQRYFFWKTCGQL